jgi:hypothetical protein
MDYARKWTDLGFLSGFYNQITNRHIGRLTTEIHETCRQKNAYELNRESQFVSPSALLHVEASMHDPIPALEKKRYISTVSFDDGFGSQYQRFIWTCIYTEHHESAVFVYRSPTKIAHNYTNDPEFIQKTEYLMNMKANYTNYDDICETETIETPDFYDVFNYIERNTDTCMKSKSMIRIKQHYWCNKNHVLERQRLYRIPSETCATAAASYTHHLAVHIRRPNCDDTRPNGGEEYTNEYYIQTLLNIRNTYNGYDSSNRIQYHIYSQGDVDKFSTIKNHNVLGIDVMLHLNETTEDTFIGMTVADILVTSASSYSYTAAFLCDGDIYYTNFWHKPCSWWNKIAVA